MRSAGVSRDIRAASLFRDACIDALGRPAGMSGPSGCWASSAMRLKIGRAAPRVYRAKCFIAGSLRAGPCAQIPFDMNTVYVVQVGPVPGARCTRT